MGSFGGEGGELLLVADMVDHLYRRMRKIPKMMMKENRCKEEVSYSSNMFSTNVEVFSQSVCVYIYIETSLPPPQISLSKDMYRCVCELWYGLWRRLKKLELQITPPLKYQHVDIYSINKKKNYFH